MSRSPHFARFASAIAAGLLLGCSKAPSTAPAVPRHVPVDAGYLAGVAVADITPPLHLSLFGHGPEGRIAAGVRLRLGCEVFVLATQTDVVALVPCDLQSPSLSLQRKVAKRLEQAGIPITADRLFIMATHTHAAPGHYFESDRYSGTFSSQAPGFDEKVLDFLVERIYEGVKGAFDALGPACVGWKQRPVTGLTRNRSYIPFLANQADVAAEDPVTLARKAEDARQTAASTPAEPEAAAAEPQPAPGALLPTGADTAVDPRLSVLAVYSRPAGALSCDASRLKGVLAVFGMHPTGVPNTNDLYHGDIFGFAARFAAGQLSEALPAGSTLPPALAAARRNESPSPDGERIVVGIANGVEGDVSPRLDFQSMAEARKHGRAFGQAIVQTVEGIEPAERAAQGALFHLSWDVKFPKGKYGDGPGEELCPHAELGMAAAGGAPDGPTRVRVIPAANAGYQPVKLSECHEQKLPLRAAGGASTQHDFPTVGPLALVDVNGAVLATVPAEITTTTGARIRHAIMSRAPIAAGSLAIVGLTNQYFQYVTTHEEYPFQYYEGASTLYGPHTEQFVVRNFGCLADVFAGKGDHCGAAGQINHPGELDRYQPPQVDRWPPAEALAAPGTGTLVACKAQREGALGWEMEMDALPLRFTSDRGDLSVTVLAGAEGTAVLDDDRGAAIEVRELGPERWRIRWIPDLSPGDARCGGEYRLAVGGKVRLLSQPFRLNCDPKPEPCRR